jgi:hypothetical protein
MALTVMCSSHTSQIREMFTTVCIEADILAHLFIFIAEFVNRYSNVGNKIHWSTQILYIYRFSWDGRMFFEVRNRKFRI